MAGIESFNHRKSDLSNDVRTGEQLRALYQRALTALNQYLTVKLGPGKAPVAGLLLNYIFVDEVLSPDDPAVAAAGREFNSLGSHILATRARELLENIPTLRRPLVSTLWVKRTIDLAHGRESVVNALDESWVFRTYSDDYPPLGVAEYDIALRDFEEQLGLELLDYVARSHDVLPSSSRDTGKDAFISALAAYAEVLNDALEHETHHENRMHHLGHLAMAARMFTYFNHQASNISLKRIHYMECCSHAGKLPGDTAKSVREAWGRFEPVLRAFLQSEDDVGASHG